jgi:hypothetical protein
MMRSHRQKQIASVLAATAAGALPAVDDAAAKEAPVQPVIERLESIRDAYCQSLSAPRNLPAKAGTVVAQFWPNWPNFNNWPNWRNF